MCTKQRRQHHHLIFAGGDLSDRQDLVLGLRMADVQHGCGTRLVLFQQTRSPVSHRHWVVGSQLTFNVLSGHLTLEKGEGNRKDMWDWKTRLADLLGYLVEYLLWFRTVWRRLSSQLDLKKKKKKERPNMINVQFKKKKKKQCKIYIYIETYLSLLIGSFEPYFPRSTLVHWSSVETCKLSEP